MMLTLDAGAIVVANRNCLTESWYVVLPSTMQRFFCALQVSGPNLKPGECFWRGGLMPAAVFGDVYEVDTTREFRMLVRDGEMRCLLMPKQV